MADASPSKEWEEFVEGSVALEALEREAEEAGTESPFESLAGRIARSVGLDLRFSFLTGVGLMLVAAALAALLPSASTASGGFWRVGPDLVRQLLTVGNALAVPLGLAAVVVCLATALGAALGGSQFGRSLLVIQPFIGGAGVLGAGAIWGAFLALALVNFAVLLLIIVLYILVAIILMSIFFGVVIGMLNG